MGAAYATKPALNISATSAGWAAPFNREDALTAVKSSAQVYQASVNVFILKLLSQDDSSINYRNVKYLANFSLFVGTELLLALAWTLASQRGSIQSCRNRQTTGSIFALIKGF